MNNGLARWLLIALAISTVRAVSAVRGPGRPAPSRSSMPLHRPFDEILDIYVRDGLVYYFALKQERGKFDRYVQALGEVGADTLKSWPPRSAAGLLDQRLQRVRPAHGDRRLSDSRQGCRTIRRTASGRSPGAFERRPFRAGGRDADARRDREGRDRRVQRCARAACAGAWRHRRRRAQERSLHRRSRLDSQLTDDGERARDAARVGLGRCPATSRLSVNPAVLLARADLHEVALANARPRRLRDAQPARARGARADRSVARAERSRVPPQEHFSHGVSRLRLAAERPARGASVRFTGSSLFNGSRVWNGSRI